MIRYVCSDELAEAFVAPAALGWAVVQIRRRAAVPQGSTPRISVNEALVKHDVSTSTSRWTIVLKRSAAEIALSEDRRRLGDLTLGRHTYAPPIIVNGGASAGVLGVVLGVQSSAAATLRVSSCGSHSRSSEISETAVRRCTLEIE